MTPSTQKRNVTKSGRLGYEACSQRTIDTTRLQDTANSFDSKLPVPSFDDMLQHYNGDKFKFAYELSQLNLSSSATVAEIKHSYNIQLGNINRYLRKARTPNNTMVQRFRKLYQPQSDKSLQIKIKGCIKVSDEYYYKDLTNNPIIVPANEVTRFIKLARENNQAGYAYLNGIYMQSGRHDDSITWLDNVEIDMSFT